MQRYHLNPASAHVPTPLQTGAPTVTADADRIAALPDQTAAAAFVHLADQLTAAFHAHLLALLDEDHPEHVHKARVTLRAHSTEAGRLFHVIVGTRSTASWAAVPREGGQLV
ncbi:CYTH domain-containing protein [Tabrizicola oligotrophica]|uniref:Uncharacterized protein n=1 Tax=Tabrizicola oligotrophica TaxID=2710650 RepID=A0A6M0QXK5_9RHOB|nr:hypothetical protein [Tabrizicola oligotrophica]NEY92195.1 hypothetical protein [Tabrizicola oligotrophica]